MDYTIKQVAKMTGLSPSTLRYYESEGILTGVRRSEDGHRLYDEDDLDWLSTICCLKSTGMSIKMLKKFVRLTAEGDSTLDERRLMMIAHREDVLRRMREFEENMDHVNFKVEYFTEACRLGTERDLKKKCYPGHFHRPEDLI